MYARAIDDAALRLRELREQELEELGVGALALGLSLVATEILPSLALPLFFGGIGVGILGLRALVRRWELVEDLAEESDAYVLPEVFERASREATMERRRTFAAAIRSRCGNEEPVSEPPLGIAADELEALASDLEDDGLALEPLAAVACSRLVSGLYGSSLPNEELSTALLHSRIRQIRSGFTVLRAES
jgi:hypothetical protein